MLHLTVRATRLFQANLEIWQGRIETSAGYTVGHVVSQVDGNLEIEVPEKIQDYLELCSEVIDC